MLQDTKYILAISNQYANPSVTISHLHESLNTNTPIITPQSITIKTTHNHLLQLSKLFLWYFQANLAYNCILDNTNENHEVTKL